MPDRLTAKEVPGAAAVVVSRETVIWEEVFGVTGAPGSSPVTPDTIFCIRSISKSFTALAVLMAVLGNAMKAFPGLGTLAGGALHAVTYGMIFDALGRSLNETLASRGELATLPVINRFTENLGDQLEKRTSDIVRLVLEAKDREDK